MSFVLVCLFSCLACCLGHVPSPAGNARRAAMLARKGAQGTGRVADILSQIIDTRAPLGEAPNNKLLNEFLNAGSQQQLEALRSVLASKTNGKSSTIIHGNGYAKKNWDYKTCTGNGPDSWIYHNYECGGFHQSPINIVTPDVVYGKNYKIRFSGSFNAIKGVTKNNGHCPVFEPTTKDQLLVNGVPYDELSDYSLVEAHIHFSGQNQQGSEHAINGEKKDAEFHFVFANKKYNSLDDAKKQQDGLAVIGVFLEVGNPFNAALSEVISECRNIQTPDTTHNTTLRTLAFLEDCRDFYTYRGSLTTPGCHESVRWIVFKDTYLISYGDMKTLETLMTYNSEPMSDNVRPVQMRYGRSVEANFPSLFIANSISNNNNGGRQSSSWGSNAGSNRGSQDQPSGNGKTQTGMHQASGVPRRKQSSSMVQSRGNGGATSVRGSAAGVRGSAAGIRGSAAGVRGSAAGVRGSAKDGGSGGVVSGKGSSRGVSGGRLIPAQVVDRRQPYSPPSKGFQNDVLGTKQTQQQSSGYRDAVGSAPYSRPRPRYDFNVGRHGGNNPPADFIAQRGLDRPRPRPSSMTNSRYERGEAPGEMGTTPGSISYSGQQLLDFESEYFK